jgi:hypothetical protein
LTLDYRRAIIWEEKVRKRRGAADAANGV